MSGPMKPETVTRHCEEMAVESNAYSREMDAALAADPPEIEWVSGPGGVKRPVSIVDPHTDTRVRGKGKRRRARKPKVERVAPAAPAPVAPEPPRDTPLLRAARTVI